MTTHISRKKLEALAWKHTHKDFKGGKGADRTIMILRAGGSCLVGLSDATEAELLSKLPAVEREQARTGRTFERGQPVSVSLGQRVIYDGRVPGVVVEIYQGRSVIVYVKLETSQIVSSSATFPSIIPEVQ